jgi:hypothetical protein
MFCNDHDHSAMFIIIVKNGRLKASDHQFVQCVRSKEVPFEKLTCTVLVDCSYGIDGPFSSMMYLLKIAVVHSKLLWIEGAGIQKIGKRWWVDLLISSSTAWLL